MTSRPRNRSRRLSADERTLWTTVTRSIAPLRTGRAPEEEADSPDETHVVKAADIPVARPPRPPVKLPKPKSPPALATLGRRMKQRAARGKDAIDGRLDLHGLTQAEAHPALLHFLATAQHREAKLVIVITGKGGRGGAEGEGGVLQRQVPHWLSLPEFRAFVVGFEEAHRTHGGAGALYVRVRRGPR